MLLGRFLTHNNVIIGQNVGKRSDSPLVTARDRALQREEQLVDPEVWVKLGMEGEAELSALPHGHHVSIHARQDLDARTRIHHAGRADEGHRHALANARNVRHGMEAPSCRP